MSSLVLVDKLLSFVMAAPADEAQEQKAVDDKPTITSCNSADELNGLLKASKSERIFLLFCGNIVGGKSWCPDCVRAKPVIESNLKYLKKEDTMITVYVGEMAAWRNKHNVFRTDERFKVTGVPTLMRLGSVQRLVEPQCPIP